MEPKSDDLRSSPVKNHLKSPDKSKPDTELEEGEISSEEESLESRKKKEKKKKREKREKRKRVESVDQSDHSTMETVSVNGVKDVSGINLEAHFL